MSRGLRLLVPLATILLLTTVAAPSGLAYPASDDQSCDCWQRIRPPSFTGDFPIDHVASAYGFDSKRGKMVKFGGKVFLFTAVDSTFEWDGLNWTEVNPPTKPFARASSAMAFDHKRGVLVMMGGYGSSPSWPVAQHFDTWEYDGTDWYMPPSANPPSIGGTATDTPGAPDWNGFARFGMDSHRMVWDPDREEILLVGGATFDTTLAAAVTLTDTWAYSGGEWTRLNPATVPGGFGDPNRGRNLHGLAEDPANSQIVLFGGTSLNQQQNSATLATEEVNAMLTDTWTWNGSDWKRIFPAHVPDIRAETQMADGNQDTAATLFGGGVWTALDLNGDGINEKVFGVLGDLWQFTGDDWQKTTTPSKVDDRLGDTGRNEFVMAYDQTRKQMIVAGGYTFTAGEETATWSWQPPYSETMRERQYFAEGYTGGASPFSEFITVQNQSTVGANVRFKFLLDNGTSIIYDTLSAIPSQARFTLNVNAVPGMAGQSHGTIIYSDQNVYAERPMYFDYNGQTGGSVDPGAADLHKEFFFAEGYTGGAFESYLTMLNTNPAPVSANVEYLLNGGVSVNKVKVIPANSRLTVKVSDDIGHQEFSAHIQAWNGFIHVEEPIYFTFNNGSVNANDGSVNLGQTMLSPTAEFAEGYTGANFQEYLTLGNPGTTDANVMITYLPTSGVPVTTGPHLVPAKERRTIDVNADLGPGVSHSTRIDSDQPIATARPMYFNYGGPAGWNGGTVNIGFSDSRWALLPEGFVNNGSFDTYVTVGNPHDTPTDITMTYAFTDGSNIFETDTVPANGRFTRKVNDKVASGTPFSVFVITIDPTKTVLVERPMYFNYTGWTGGSVSAGYNGSPLPRYYP